MSVKLAVITLTMLAGCASTAAQDSASTQMVALSDEAQKTVAFSYENETSDAQCILADDFRNHPSRPLLRLVGSDGSVALYSGIQYDRELEPERPAFFIVPPGKSVEARFDVDQNYAVQAGQTYRVSYSLPVTPCVVLNVQEIEVPLASMPFYLGPADDFTDWSDRLVGVRGIHETWSAAGGQFIELEQTVLIPASE